MADSNNTDPVNAAAAANYLVEREYQLEWRHEFEIDLSDSDTGYDHFLLEALDGYYNICGGYQNQNTTSIRVTCRKIPSKNYALSVACLPADIEYRGADKALDPAKYAQAARRTASGTTIYAASSNTAIEQYVLTARLAPGVSTSAHPPVPPARRQGWVIAVQGADKFSKGCKLTGHIDGTTACSGHGYHDVVSRV